MSKLLHFFLLSFFFLTTSFSVLRPSFQVVVLGCGGGPLENNLSSYLFAPITDHNFIAMDAGTLLSGLQIAYEKKAFNEIPLSPTAQLDPVGEIFQEHIRAYFVSHAHLDHVSGLVINSTADIRKNIYGLTSTIDDMRDNLFNWKIWPNFADEGRLPHLKKYHYVRLPLEQQIAVPKTKLTVQAFPLSHPDSYGSTAFLMQNQEEYILYFGDTGPDSLSEKKLLNRIWEKIAPLVRKRKMHALFLECSFKDGTPSSQLYGHLTPAYVMEALRDLAQKVSPDHPEQALKELKVVVTHIKDSLSKNSDPKIQIRQDLDKLNDLGVEWIFPSQGERIEL